MAGRRIIYLAVLAGLLVFYVFYREWFAWFSLVLGLCLPPFSLVLSLPAVCTVRGRFRCPDTLAPGRPARAAASVSSPLPVPPFRCRLRVTHAITGNTRIQKVTDPLPTGVCGRLTLQPVRPRIYDYLGLFRFPLRRWEPAGILIWPAEVPMESVPDFSPPPESLEKASPDRDFSDRQELRPYRPGDSLRQIHWKLSAKTGELIFRELTVPVTSRIRLALVLSGSGAELNRKLGQLLWLGSWLLERQIPWEIAAVTGAGFFCVPVDHPEDFRAAMTRLLSSPAAADSVPCPKPPPDCRQYEIRGDPDEM